MVTLEHVVFSFDLELTADTHVGDGRTERFDALRPGERPGDWVGPPVEKGKPAPEVATIVRDHTLKPTVPATALKGALRKATTAHLGRTRTEELFGKIGEKDSGSMGRFSFYSGHWKSGPQGPLSLPYWDPDARSWISTHVAIGRDHGSADPQKLYNVEMVPAGTVFRIEGVWFGSLASAEKELPELLRPLAADEGLPIGAGHRLGLGTGVIVGRAIDLRCRRFDASDGSIRDLPAKTISVAKPEPGARPIVLALSCPGPFASIDPARRRCDNRAANHISALKRSEGLPVLHPETIAGALRARAAWLAITEGIGQNRAGSADDPFIKPSAWKSPFDLTPVERLFGVSGWRGLLRLSRPIPLTADSMRKLTSIAIDRFSGAVLDSTLFEHEIFLGVALTVELRLEQRRHEGLESLPAPDDLRLLRRLLEDLNGDVLPLGHATNRGFGWFDATVSGLEGLAR